MSLQMYCVEVYTSRFGTVFKILFLCTFRASGARTGKMAAGASNAVAQRSRNHTAQARRERRRPR